MQNRVKVETPINKGLELEAGMVFVTRSGDDAYIITDRIDRGLIVVLILVSGHTFTTVAETVKGFNERNNTTLKPNAKITIE